MKIKAQGTVEYLVILAVVVVLALIVVGLVVGVFNSPSQQISTSGNQLGLKSQAIGITESLIDPHDGNYVIRLLNNSGENLTVSNVSVGDTNVLFSEELAQGVERFFVVNTDEVCSLGKIVSEDVVVTYVTRDGLTKVERYPVKVMFNCTPYVVNVNLVADQCPSCADPGFGFIEFNTPSYSATDGGTTVTDSANNLVWQASSYGPGSKLTWQNAMNYCNNNTPALSGNGWRLPNVVELGLLYNYSSWRMYESPFSNSINFWSSTAVSFNTSVVYFLDYDMGIIYASSKTSITDAGVRCVRSA